MQIKIFFFLSSLAVVLSVSQLPKMDPLASNTRQQAKLFDGAYGGTATNQAITINLKASSGKVIGTMAMNGETASLKGTYKTALAEGLITEDISKKTYTFSATESNDQLTFTLIFPEYAHQKATFTLHKIKVNDTKVTTLRDPKLIGTWRYTEVISSGSGQFYSSFATHHFAQFHADGSAVLWTGKSAGGTKDITIEGKDMKNIQRMEWLTAGKVLYLVDPKTQKRAPVNYYVEPKRMMLSNGKNKKVYQRVGH